MGLMPNRQSQAFQELIMEARGYWATTLYPQLRAEHDTRTALAATEGRPAESPEEIAALFRRSTLYQAFGFLERHIQKAKYSSRWGLAPELDRNRAGWTAREALVGEGDARLKLDPALPVPDYYAAYDIHQHPGNLHGADTAGVVYEVSALSIHPNTKRNELHERFTALLADQGRFRAILDMGCGFGKSALPLAQAFPEAQVTGIDLSAPCLRLAAASAVEAQVQNIRYEQRDLRRSGLPDRAFDLVTSTMVLHELPVGDIEETVKETHRLLADGGLSVHLDFGSDDPFMRFLMFGHAKRNNEPFMEPLMRMDIQAAYRRAGFETLEIAPFAEREGSTDPGYPYWRFPWAMFIARKPAAAQRSAA